MSQFHEIKKFLGPCNNGCNVVLCNHFLFLMPSLHKSEAEEERGLMCINQKPTATFQKQALRGTAFKWYQRLVKGNNISSHIFPAFDVTSNGAMEWFR